MIEAEAALSVNVNRVEARSGVICMQVKEEIHA